MPHQIIKGKGPLAGHSKTKKVVSGIKKAVKSVVNPDANRTSKNPIARAKHDIKVKKEDKAFVKKWEGKNARAKKFSRGSDGPGLSAEHRLEARKRHRVSQEKKQDRAALKKSDPAKYRAQKKAERKARLLMRTRGPRS